MTAGPVDTAAPPVANGDALSCWLEAVGRRREQLGLDIRAGDRARAVLDTMVNVRRGMSGIAEDFYAKAWAALERARFELADYDRQSQGALNASSQRVREASRRLSELGMGPSAKPGMFYRVPKDSAIRKLEQEHRDAHAADAGLLEARSSGRVPYEHRWHEAARDVLLGGLGLLSSLEADRPRLAAATERAARAQAELRDLEKLSRRASMDDAVRRITPVLSGLIHQERPEAPY